MPAENTSLPTDPSPTPEAPQEFLIPRVTTLLTTLILDPTMPPALFRSYARLYAASWRHTYRHTEPLEFDLELVPLLGVRPTQARQHLRYLRFAKLLDWESDGSNRYVISFPASPDSEDPQPVVVNGLINIFKNTQQQLKDSAKPNFRKNQGASPTGRENHPHSGGSASPSQPQESGALPGGEEGSAPIGEAQPVDPSQAELRQVTLHFLGRAGVWPDVAERIAEKLVENQRRGHPYLPTLADVLGWIAYCFGDQQKYNIAQPAALLAANLSANRCCPEKYRPPLICKACGFAEDFCECEDEPDYHYPSEFLEYALKKRRETYTTSVWGVCLSCQGFPCQCD